MFNSSLNNPYLIESYINGDNWYRIYSDGWCEQGGKVITTDQNVTVNLLKPYSNSDYSLMRTNISDSSTATSVRMESVYELTSTNFKISSFSAIDEIIWEAKGVL